MLSPLCFLPLILLVEVCCSRWSTRAFWRHGTWHRRNAGIGCQKRVSLLTLAAIAQIRISLLLSFLRYFSAWTDRVSDKAVEVDRICSHGLPSAGRNGWNGEWTNLFCRREGLRTICSWCLWMNRWVMRGALPAILFVLCSATSLVSLHTPSFQELQSDDACDMSLWRELATCCALITACLSLSEFSWKLSSGDAIMRPSVCNCFFNCASWYSKCCVICSCWSSRSCKVLR